MAGTTNNTDYVGRHTDCPWTRRAMVCVRWMMWSLAIATSGDISSAYADGGRGHEREVKRARIVVATLIPHPGQHVEHDAYMKRSPGSIILPPRGALTLET